MQRQAMGVALHIVVNLGGIPGGGWQFGFSIFCILLVVLIGGVALWLHRSKWL